MISLTVEGLTQALEKLGAIEAKVALAAKPMAEAAADPVLERARSLVPVDTGRLHDSLETKPDPQDATAVLVGTDVEYARWPEFGTVNMAAQPYLRPAADSGGGSAGKLAGLVLLRAIGRFA
ncbi:MAG: HK97 gp10 family phage protein [Actinomycetota bacterium]|nr:HK97 gp10 family phage protein [Actinomycetota bacterium]